MDDYISREALIDRLSKNLSACNPGTFSEMCYADAIETVKHLPAADVAPLVRCRDCEYSNKALYGWLWCTAGPCEGKVVLEDFYCKCGERKEGADND